MVTVEERARHAVDQLKAGIDSAELRLFKVPGPTVSRPGWMTAAAGAAAGLAVIIVIATRSEVLAPELGSPSTPVPEIMVPATTTAVVDPPKGPATSEHLLVTTTTQPTTTTGPTPTTTAAPTTTSPTMTTTTTTTTTTTKDTTTTTITEVEFSANATWLERSVLPPYDEYYGTATPGTSISVVSEYGSGDTVVGREGQWYVKVEFPEAPFGLTFEVTVRHQGGKTFTFPFTNRAG
jgi:hypothetical protein